MAFTKAERLKRLVRMRQLDVNKMVLKNEQIMLASLRYRLTKKQKDELSRSCFNKLYPNYPL